MEPGVEPVVRQALRALEGLGAGLEEVSIPHMPYALAAVLVTETASVTTWHEPYLRDPARRARYTPEVRRLMDAGKFVFATDFLKAQRLRRAPTLPVRAWRADQQTVVIGGQEESILNACWRYTYPWNLTGQPAVTVPCGFAEGMPVGLQVVGKPFDEAGILRVAHAYEQATRWHDMRPPDPEARAA